MFDRVRTFKSIVVHPTQELPIPSADSYRGGPAWPHFGRQVLVRHCWGAIPVPVDFEPHPGETEFPYFDPDRFLNPRYKIRRRWCSLPSVAAPARRPPDCWVDEAGSGFWCGPITDHFGHLIADFGMRTALSAQLDATTPLVFGIWPTHGAEPPAVFWDILDHLGVDRRRVMLVRRPTRFDRLSVVPQAERSYGGHTTRRHLRRMDALTTASLGPPPRQREDNWVFVSRSRMQRANFAGEAYLDEALAAAGVSIFHPETADLRSQLQRYRRARRLIFSEGSALQALQLLGRLDAEIVVLPRREGGITRNIAALRALRARARSLRGLPTLRGIVCGLTENGEPQPSRGISLFDEPRLLADFAALGIPLARVWDSRTFAARRDADIALWTERRLAAGAHPDESGFIAQQLRRFSL